MTLPEPLREPTSRSLLDRRKRVLGGRMPLFYNEPLHLVRGDGVHLFDVDGRRFVDMYNNVPCVGHANERVVAAMSSQQATLNVHSRYLHDGVVELAERLTGLHSNPLHGHAPANVGPIESAIFACSGTEAVEIAMTTARLATGKRGIICSNATYHGNTETVIQLTRAARQPERCPEIRAIPFPETFRPIATPAGTAPSDTAVVDAYLDHLREAIADLERSGVGFAGLILCSILANEGLPDIPDGYMARASQIVRDAGGIVIADEVQAGYGRAGTWWGYSVSGLEPAIVVTGKPMGNGLPLSAVAMSADLVDCFRRNTRYFNTFASSPLQAAVGLAVIDEIEDRSLCEHAATVGAHLKSALTERLPARRWLGDVRGTGLFIGVEMVTDPETDRPDADRAVDVVNRLKDKGFLTSNAGAHNNVLKIRPPLVFGRSEADDFLAAFDEMLSEIDD